MTKIVRTVIAALAAIGFCAASLSGGASAGAASAVPFTDADRVGYIGFCNAQNHQIRSGSIESQPFAVKAVSSAAAPAGYAKPAGRATLYVYQPIQYVDPGDWSGKAMTGSSAFTNNAHPMAAGLRADPSLVNFSAVFPAHLDGFVEFRIYFSAPNSGTYIRPYPAVAVQITGKTWHQVGGASVDCGAGKVASNEDDLPTVQHLQTAGPGNAGLAASGKPGTSSHNQSGAQSSASSGSLGGTNGAATSSSAPVGTSASTSADSTSSSAPVVVIAIIAALVVGGGGYLLLRRRRAATA